MNLTDGTSRPDWELLVSWVAVIETGSVSEAARLLRISQAAVSQRVKQLEGIFGTSLLDRSTRPAQPTAAGQRLFENSKTLLTQADQLMESVRNVSRAKRMIVRIGCVDSFAATIGPVLFKALSSLSHQIRLWSGISPNLESAIENRQLDLAVTTGTQALPGIARVQLFTEPYFVVLPKSYDTQTGGTLSDVARHLQFIRYSARSCIGQQIDEYLQTNGDALERTCEFDASDPLLSLVASGMGFGITTPLCLWQARHFASAVKLVPLPTFMRRGHVYPNMTRTFFLSHRHHELGTLPNEVKDLVRISVRRQISSAIAAELGLQKNVLLTPPDAS